MAEDSGHEQQTTDYRSELYWDEKYTELIVQLEEFLQQGEEASVGSKLNAEQPRPGEWYRTFEGIKKILTEHLPAASSDVSILHLGCGLSNVPEGLHRLGYTSQTAVDLSNVCIRYMTTKYAHLKPPISWQKVNVVNMSDFADRSFNVAFDKGTLDAIIGTDPFTVPPPVKNDIDRYIKEVVRVLKDGGIWLCVTTYSVGMEQFLEQGMEAVWTTQHVEVKPTDGGGSFYRAWILKKKN